MSGLPPGAGALLGKRLGKYEILALLALGGTAEIYLARIGGTAGFEKYVVIKCLHDHLADDPDFVKMFLDEARLAALLDHSNIVQTFELGEYEHRYYMVMEYLAGLSLAMVVRRAAERLPDGKLPVALILNMAAQAAAGLHYAHDRQANGRPLNMVHRDISPQNLVIGFEGVVKVVDFGIARAELRETKTKAGTIKGKFAYMSPEQCIAANVDRRTDVFALGVIVWELLTVRRLFKRNSPYETYQAVLECAVDPPSSLNHELDPGLDTVVMKALTKDREDRYPSAEAFGDAMLAYLHQRGKSSGPGEVGRFLEESFAQEIEEHSERMRELIGSRDASMDSGLNWSDEDDPGKQTVDLGGRKDLSIEDDMPPPEDGEIPADKTRIEANPLDRIKELDETVANRKQSATAPVPTGAVTNGPARLPAPPTVALGKPNIQQSSNAPTVVGEVLAPELAPTALGHTVDEQGRPSQVQISQQPGSLYPVMQGGRPFSSDLAPSDVPMPQRSPYAGDHAPAPHSGPHGAPGPGPYGQPPGSGPYGHPGPHSAQYAVLPSAPHPVLPSSPHAALHPSGEHYQREYSATGQVLPARTMPPWMLAVLFVGALGLALTITIVIARIIR